MLTKLHGRISTRAKVLAKSKQRLLIILNLQQIFVQASFRPFHCPSLWGYLMVSLLFHAYCWLLVLPDAQAIYGKWQSFFGWWGRFGLWAMRVVFLRSGHRLVSSNVNVTSMVRALGVEIFVDGAYCHLARGISVACGLSNKGISA